MRKLGFVLLVLPLFLLIAAPVAAAAENTPVVYHITQGLLAVATLLLAGITLFLLVSGRGQE